MMIHRRGFVGGIGSTAALSLGAGQLCTTILRRRETVLVTDRGASVAGLRAAIREVANYDGGTVRLQCRSLAVDPEELIASGSIQLPSNVLLEGEGAILSYSGKRVAPPLFVAKDVSHIALRNIVATGNGQAVADARSGSFALFTLSDTAKEGMEDIRLENIRLSDFRAERWIQFLQRNSSGREMIGLRVTDLRVDGGGSLEPSAIGVSASPLWFYGADGDIRDVVVQRLTVNADRLKQGVVLFHKVRQAVIDSAMIVDAGKVGAKDDAGAYAIMAYANPGEMSDILINAANVQRPRSVGVYLRGVQRVRVTNSSITGQTDRVTTNLPKGAIALDGCSGVTIDSATLSDNQFDLSVADGGVNALELEVRDMQTSGAGTSVILAVSPGKGPVEGARFLDCRLSARDRVFRVMNEQVSGRYYNDVQIIGGVLHSETAANVIELTQQDSTAANRYRIEGVIIQANNVAIMAAGLQGSLTIRRTTIEGLGSLVCGIVADDCPLLDWDGIVFRNLGSGYGYAARSLRGSVGGKLHNLQLEGSAKRSINGSLKISD